MTEEVKKVVQQQLIPVLEANVAQLKALQRAQNSLDKIEQYAIYKTQRAKEITDTAVQKLKELKNKVKSQVDTITDDEIISLVENIEDMLIDGETYENATLAKAADELG